MQYATVACETRGLTSLSRASDPFPAVQSFDFENDFFPRGKKEETTLSRRCFFAILPACCQLNSRNRLAKWRACVRCCRQLLSPIRRSLHRLHPAEKPNSQYGSTWAVAISGNLRGSFGRRRAAAGAAQHHSTGAIAGKREFPRSWPCLVGA